MSSIAAESAPESLWQKLDRARRTMSEKGVLIPAILLTLGFFIAFQELIQQFRILWLSEDGYYSHGFIVPIISGYIIYRWWPRIRSIPVQPSWWMALPVAALLWANYIATPVRQFQIVSYVSVLTLFFSVWFLLGRRWAFALALPIFYLLFAMPVFGQAIEVYTNPLQKLSTDVAFQILQAAGYSPWLRDSTTIHLNNFVLDVGVPCSGLKLVFAVTAFTTFFVMIGGLKWWGNLIMIGLIIPLSLFVNGLRIALIGVVGQNYGSEAGHQFHDYSGYITLIVCFLILFKIARWLGWKD